MWGSKGMFGSKLTKNLRCHVETARMYYQIPRIGMILAIKANTEQSKSETFSIVNDAYFIVLEKLYLQTMALKTSSNQWTIKESTVDTKTKKRTSLECNGINMETDGKHILFTNDCQHLIFKIIVETITTN